MDLRLRPAGRPGIADLLHALTLLYRLDAAAADVADSFGARAGDDPWAGSYCAPGKFAPVVTAGREFIAGPKSRLRSSSEAVARQRLVPRLWGVMPPPSAGDPSRLVATVRNPDSPFWIGNLRNSEFRCLVPATAFMEWGSGTYYEGRRLKHWFAPEAGGIFAMAGVWKDDEVPGFALLTVDAKGLPKELGCKAMPLVLPDRADARQAWLHGGWAKANALAGPAQAVVLRELEAPGEGR